jgi:choline dehydrogenase-like flavoprotein
LITWTLATGGFAPAGITGVRTWDWVGGKLFGIDNPLLIAIIAGVIETVVVPVSVFLQKLVTIGLHPAPAPSVDELEKLFKDSIDPLEKTKPRRDFGFLFLRVAGIAFATYLGYVIVCLIVGARDLPLSGVFFLNPIATLNTFGKLSILSALAAAGAFNVRVRRSALAMLALGHLFAVGSSLWLYFAYPGNPLFPADHNFILTSAIVDGVLLALLVVLMFRYPSFDEGNDFVDDIEIQSPAATAMRIVFVTSGIIFSLVLIGAIVGRIIGRPGSLAYTLFGGPDPLVINTITKFGTLAGLSFLLAAKPRLRPYFVPALVVALSFSVIGAFIYTVTGPIAITTPNGSVETVGWYMPVDLLLAVVMLAVMLGVRRMQYHVDYRITSLRPTSADCVMALHDAMREPEQFPELSRREVLARIDEYIVGIRGRRRGLIGFPFFILEHIFTRLFLLPSFSVLSREEARWMLRSLVLRPSYERSKAAIPPLADMMFQIGDILHSLLSLAFFSSQRGQGLAGYVLPDARERLQKEVLESTERPPDGAGWRMLPVDGNDPTGRRPLSDPDRYRTLLAPRIGVPSDDRTFPKEVDYCIIGSGAAGGVLAYRLAEKHPGASICVLEQGGYYGPRVDFNDDEMRMVRMLYTEGGLQVTRSFDFTILQGECVGGTTVINNAVCFEMPEPSRREWERFGIDVSALEPYYAKVAGEIHIDVLTPESVNHRAESRFIAGVNGYNNAPGVFGPLSAPSRVRGNFENCYGCGLCNIGCRRMRKMSVLETYLPWAQSRGVQVLPNTGAVKCEYEERGGRKKITGIVVHRPDGTFARIGVRKGAVVAGGAIASSRFLFRSGVGGENVGRGVSCNFACPTLVEFPETIDAFDGLQITMFAAPESYDAIFETTYNPPGTHSIVMPQYFGMHGAMMKRYRQSVNFGALVGSDPGGEVSPDRSIIFGRAIEWRQTPDDIRRIKGALTTMARFAKEAGADRILLPTHPVLSVPLDGNLDSVLDAFNRTLNDPSYFNFATAHPQGGNMRAADTVAERVVDLDFRVRDCENLYACDASIFPRGIRVNPQWTIMALASQASEMIA